MRSESCNRSQNENNRVLLQTTKPKIFELIESKASLEEVQKELDVHSSDVNCEYGHSTALIKAARTGREDLVKLLVLYGSKINQPAGADQSTPIKSAIRQKDYSMVSLLLELGATLNDGRFYTFTPLYEALGGYDFYKTQYDRYKRQGLYESLDKMGKIVNLLVQEGAVIT